MKYLCDACERLAEPESFRAEGLQLLLRCGRCGADTTFDAQAGQPATLAVVARAAESADARPPSRERPVALFSVPRPTSAERPAESEPAAAPIPVADRCPKCASAKDSRAACAKCGLVFALYKPEQDVVPQSARRDFDRLLDAWGTPESARLLAGLPVEAVPHVGRLCRHRLADAPSDTRAAGLLQTLSERTMAIAAAAAQSEGLARQAQSGVSRSTATIIIAVGIMAVLGLLLHYAHFGG